MTLDEILAEGERLEAAFKSTPSPLYVQIVAGDKLSLFYVAHGPRLLAVARAGVEAAPQLEGFCVQAETDARPPGGQQAGLDKSWASRVPPSVLTELRWYAREFRRFLDAAAAPEAK